MHGFQCRCWFLESERERERVIRNMEREGERKKEEREILMGGEGEKGKIEI